MGDRHGVAVAEIIKDMAPGAELFLATTATTAETHAAIDWFAANNVRIITRSLGAPYDGPGDGTGPLDSVVDYAADRGITWFNSGGNDAAFGYGRYTDGVDASGYLDFFNGPGVDTMLRIDGQSGGVAFDGIRWANDWNLPPGEVTDYSVEVWQGVNEASATQMAVLDDPQIAGAPPLEAVDQFFNVGGAGQALFLRIRAQYNYSASAPDTVEVATFFGAIEPGRRSAPFSAAKPVVDSRNPALVAVGAIDPADGSTGIAFYSSQGPTNDGRIKPDVSAPSCVASTVYAPMCFNGTSAASPAAAGLAALLYGHGLAVSGMPLAALVKHLAVDLGPPGPDNAFGAGAIQLPAVPPQAVSQQPSAFVALGAPVRLLDTRPASFTGPANLVGPYPQYSIIDLPVSTSGVIPPNATSIAVNITSTEAVSQFYVQALPTLGGALGGFSDDERHSPGQNRPNFAIVPLGQGSISIFIPTGGNVIVDAMGYFAPSTTTAAGRFVPINPRRALDTRPTEAGPVPNGWTAHRPGPGESVRVEVPAGIGVPATGLSALVVNVTATDSIGAGFLQALPTGNAPGFTSTVNYVAARHGCDPRDRPVRRRRNHQRVHQQLVAHRRRCHGLHHRRHRTRRHHRPVRPCRACPLLRQPIGAQRDAPRWVDRGGAVGGSARRRPCRCVGDLDEPDLRSRGRPGVRHGISVRRFVPALVEPQLRRSDHGRQCSGGQAVGDRIPEYLCQHGYTCHHRCQRLLHGDLVSDQTDTKTGWLDNELLDNIRANVPLVYVDAVPVRVNDVGRVTDIGLLLRQAADGSISRMVVTGRVLYGERVRDALLRHLEKDLGPVALPRIPPEVAPFTVVEYFPDPDISGFHDPRHHAVSLAFVVPVVRRLPTDAGGTRPRLVLARRGHERTGAQGHDGWSRSADPTGPRARRPVALALVVEHQTERMTGGIEIDAEAIVFGLNLGLDCSDG